MKTIYLPYLKKKNQIFQPKFCSTGYVVGNECCGAKIMGLEWKGDEDEGKKVSIEADSKITFKNNHIYKKKILRNADLTVHFFPLCPS